MSDPTWRAEIEKELENAEAARAAGNEGRARVCARRAAGIAAREYLRRIRRPVSTPSAYALLQLLAGSPGLPADLRQAAVHLTRRVDEDFDLPSDVDLIADARRLCSQLPRL